MASDKDYKTSTTYIIPHSYDDSGRFFNGLLKIRNTIEGVIIGGLIFLFELLIIYPLFSVQINLLIALFTIVPALVACIMGINGDCFTIFIKTLFVYIKNKRELRFRRIYNEKSYKFNLIACYDYHYCFKC